MNEITPGVIKITNRHHIDITSHCYNLINVNDSVVVWSRNTKGEDCTREIAKVLWLCKDKKHFYIDVEGKARKRRLSSVSRIYTSEFFSLSEAIEHDNIEKSGMGFEAAVEKYAKENDLMRIDEVVSIMSEPAKVEKKQFIKKTGLLSEFINILTLLILSIGIDYKAEWYSTVVMISAILFFIISFIVISTAIFFGEDSTKKLIDSVKNGFECRKITIFDRINCALGYIVDLLLVLMFAANGFIVVSFLWFFTVLRISYIEKKAIKQLESQ